MPSLNEVAQEFMAQPRIAVAGVSHTTENTASAIYKVLKQKGKQVFPINPNADSIDGDKCYASVKDIPGGVDGVVIVTRPEITAKVVRDCAEAGVKRVWMHNNTLGPSSVSDEAVAFCKQNNITVIAGACPMMFIDPMHKFMRVVLGAMGRLPQPS
jgi:predicted CoA-binding protein